MRVRRWLSTGIAVALVAGACTAESRSSAQHALRPPRADAAAPANMSPTAAIEWMTTFTGLVRRQRLSPPVASRIYAYAAVGLDAAVAPSASLLAQLLDAPVLPSPPAGSLSSPAVVAAAASRIGESLFPSRSARASIHELRDRQFAAIHESASARAVARSNAYGRAIGNAIARWSESDGYTEAGRRGYRYTPPAGVGRWAPTAPGYARAIEPYWGTLRPFRAATAECPVAAPAAFSAAADSQFSREARAVLDASRQLTDEQRAAAKFWNDSPGTSSTPAGHWVTIVAALAPRLGLDLRATTRLMASVTAAVADAFIATWKAKYEFNVVRPIAYIREHLEPAWTPMLVTPPFPEYPSGHSVASSAAATVLTRSLGERSFDAGGSHVFTSFEAAARQAASSRLWGGIHYPMAIENGLSLGRCIGREYAVGGA